MEALNFRLGFGRGCLAPWERVAGTRDSLKGTVSVGDEGFGGRGRGEMLEEMNRVSKVRIQGGEVDVLRNDRKMGWMELCRPLQEEKDVFESIVL